MPKKGFKAITIKETIYNQVNELAEKEDRSIASITTEAINQYLQSHEGK